MRQGQCTRCRILWTWSMSLPLRQQVCRICFEPLTRVRTSQAAALTALTVEGYRVAQASRHTGTAETKGCL